MSFMNSLQIFVKLSPFITAHNSNILSHTTVYSLYPHNFLKIVHWPPFFGRSRKKSNTGSLYPHTRLHVPWMMHLFLVPPTHEQGGHLTVFSLVCTPVKHSARETKNKKNKTHAYQRQRLGRVGKMRHNCLDWTITCVLQAHSQTYVLQLWNCCKYHLS